MSLTIEERIRAYVHEIDAALAAQRPRPEAPTNPKPVPSALARTLRGRLGTAAAVALALVVIVFGAFAAVHSQTDRPTTVHAGEPGPGPFRELFRRTSPNGITVVALAGRVPVAAAAECPVVPVPAHDVTRFCTNEYTLGVQFDMIVGDRRYRAVVLNQDIPLGAPGPALVPMTTPAVLRLVLANGTSVEALGTLPQLAVLYAQSLADVEINSTRAQPSRRDHMAPIDGWVAFPAPNDPPFDAKVRGVDRSGHVITALPFRCC